VPLVLETVRAFVPVVAQIGTVTLNDVLVGVVFVSVEIAMLVMPQMETVVVEVK
jgi:hypothetical protein